MMPEPGQGSEGVAPPKESKATMLKKGKLEHWASLMQVTLCDVYIICTACRTMWSDAIRLVCGLNCV